MAHLVKSRDKLLTRVRRIKGQAEGIERLLEADGDCNKVLQQIAAVRGAVNGLMAEVLESHVREHLGAEGLTAEQRQAETEDVIKALRSYMK